jgi:hypothetical protein
MWKTYTIIFCDPECNEVPITWDLVDSPITRVWTRVVYNALSAGGEVGEYQLIPSGSPERIRANWLALQSLSRQLGLPLVPDWDSIIDAQPLLNRLHREFHLFGEHPDTQHVSNAPMFRELNRVIHTLEQQLKDTNRLCRGVVHLTRHEPQPIKLEWWPLFGRSPQPGDLTLGYHTIGKDLWNVYQDNDVELVRAGMIRPQESISSEVCFSFGHRPWSRTNESKHAQIVAWLERYGLKDLVDLNDPRMCNHGQALLGQYKGSLTFEEIDHVFATMAPVEAILA